MNTKIKIVLGILISLIIGYFIGQKIPIEFLHPKIEEKPLETKDFYNLVVQIIAAFATFLAVLIALFREEIRRWWEYVDIKYEIPENKFIEVLNSNIGDPANGKSLPLEAQKYLCTLDIINSGTITSYSTEIILESLIVENKEYTSPQNLDPNGLPLNWGSSNEQKIVIPPNGKKKVAIFELIAPEKESSPEGQESSTLPQLCFSGVTSNNDFSNGVWKATYLVYSSNCKPKRFEIHITWNGKWQSRKTEMQNCLKIDLKN